MSTLRLSVSSVLLICAGMSISDAFSFDGSRRLLNGRSSRAASTLLNVEPTTPSSTTEVDPTSANGLSSRRSWLFQSASLAAAATFAALPESASAGERLVDKEIGNSDASVSRRWDNSNVIFEKDFYFTSGTAPAWIEPGSTEYPKTMPFTKSQQRYDALKKYSERILQGIATIKGLESMSSDSIADPTAADVYQLRPMGLMANAFMSSENSGSPSELYLARWYINEASLLIGDMRKTDDPASRKKLYSSVKKAVNSYLTLMNRVISAKVGDKFEYI